MTEITFYHLTETSVDDALPGLVEKALGRGWTVTVQAQDEEAVTDLDTLLWGFDPQAFLPHGRDGDADPEAHPVFVTSTPDNPNASQMRFVVNRCALPDDLAPFERIALMFDGQDGEIVDDARTKWKALKAAGHALTYWKQTPEGRWEKAA
ncbi:MAG: DNA polymerase III subunit chi [Pseudomonadota bacterium]